MDNKYVCTQNVIHDEVIDKLKGKELNEDKVNELANLFKCMGDPTRVKILNILMNTEACVCDIAVLTNMTHSAISHQLRVLKMSRLVKMRKSGKVVFYSLDDDHVKEIFNKGLNHIIE
ncbi:ArsR/SmtB family transcription factor [Clostridium culturomicium]|uniref:ArsR/SmtB family transcription factor n=1 Tax=Clostridium culturomicium TaxID=1499683 RepID=UPI00058EEECB|nr:metalloregulator ArsR/SmtB family transcription factor [Clostridium culturomicium]